MPSLKEDSSFKEFISLGKVATKRIIDYLEDHGHNIIELERGAQSNRLWDYKEKRLRVPDLLCINCGRRIESRGKKELEITMSHSTSSEDREYDAHASDEDWVALVKCSKYGDLPEQWEAADEVEIISFEQLRETEDQAKKDRGGPTQGSELTLTWPSTTATADGTVDEIKEGDTQINIKRETDDYTLWYKTEKKIDDDSTVKLKTLVEEGDTVTGETEFIAAPMTPINNRELQCSSSYSEEHFIDDLTKSIEEVSDFVDVFSAAKALGEETFDSAVNSLRSRFEELSPEDGHREKYLKLEIAHSLAKHEQQVGWDYLEDKLAIQGDNDSERLETIMMLGENPTPRSLELLIKKCNQQDELSELRAEALNSLRKLVNSEVDIISDPFVENFADESLVIKRDAIDGLSEIIKREDLSILDDINNLNQDEQLGVALSVAKAINSDELSNPTNVLTEVANQDSLPRNILLLIFGLTKPEIREKFQNFEDLSEEIKLSVETLSNFFTSWGDILSEDMRYKLRASDD